MTENMTEAPEVKELVTFKVSLPNCTVCNCKFDGPFFTTDDPGKIAALRAYKMQYGISVEEVDAQALPAALEPNQDALDVAAIFASIKACTTTECLDAIVAELDAKYPDGIGIEEADQEAIAQAVAAKYSNLAPPSAQDADAILAAAKRGKRK